MSNTEGFERSIQVRSDLEVEDAVAKLMDLGFERDTVTEVRDIAAGRMKGLVDQGVREEGPLTAGEFLREFLSFPHMEGQVQMIEEAFGPEAEVEVNFPDPIPRTRTDDPEIRTAQATEFILFLAETFNSDRNVLNALSDVLFDKIREDVDPGSLALSPFGQSAGIAVHELLDTEQGETTIGQGTALSLLRQTDLTPEEIIDRLKDTPEFLSGDSDPVLDKTLEFYRSGRFELPADDPDRDSPIASIEHRNRSPYLRNVLKEEDEFLRVEFEDADAAYQQALDATDNALHLEWLRNNPNLSPEQKARLMNAELQRQEKESAEKYIDNILATDFGLSPERLEDTTALIQSEQFRSLLPSTAQREKALEASEKYAKFAESFQGVSNTFARILGGVAFQSEAISDVKEVADALARVGQGGPISSPVLELQEKFFDMEDFDFRRMQFDFFKAGYYEEAGYEEASQIPWGDRNDPVAYRQFNSAIRQTAIANRQGLDLTVEDIIETAVRTGPYGSQATQADLPSLGEITNALLRQATIRVDDPAKLSNIADEMAISLLGRRATSAERARFIGVIQNEQQAQQMNEVRRAAAARLREIEETANAELDQQQRELLEASRLSGITPDSNQPPIEPQLTGDPAHDEPAMESYYAALKAFKDQEQTQARLASIDAEDQPVQEVAPTVQTEISPRDRAERLLLQENPEEAKEFALLNVIHQFRSSLGRPVQ